MFNTIHEISLPSVTPSNREIAAEKLVTLFNRLVDTNGIAVVSPVLGHTGYIDREIEIPAASTFGLKGKHVAFGLDEHGRKAIYVKVRQTSPSGHIEEGQLCLFERHAPTSGVWVQGTPDSISFMHAEASPEVATAFVELVETGSTKCERYDNKEVKFELI